MRGRKGAVFLESRGNGRPDFGSVKIGCAQCAGTKSGGLKLGKSLFVGFESELKNKCIADTERKNFYQTAII